jgi:hypothetical protein
MGDAITAHDFLALKPFRGARLPFSTSSLPLYEYDSDIEGAPRRTTVLDSAPRRILHTRDAITMRIMIAGIEANAHFTMKMTIDKKGM